MRDLLPANLDPGVTITLSAPFFLLLFVGIIFYVYRKDKKRDYEKHSQIPLDDGVQKNQEQMNNG